MQFTPEKLLEDDSFLNYCFNRNPSDVTHWQQAIATNADLATNAKKAQKILGLLQATFDHEALPASLNAFEKLLHPAKIKPLWQNKWAIAAAVACVVLGAWFSFVPVAKQNPIAFITQMGRPVAWQNGDNRQNITLPDGSKVILGYHSTLTLDGSFNEQNRALSLVGEAFFEVAHNAQKPFLVQSRQITTQALGTAFLVEAYPHQSQIKVSLAEGKVKVSDPKLAKMLLPGQQIVAIQEGQLQKKRFDSHEINDWKANKLLFNKASFDQVLTRLSTHYGVQFKVNQLPENPLYFTGDLTNQSLSESLEVIGAVNHFDFDIIDQQVKISF